MNRIDLTEAIELMQSGDVLAFSGTGISSRLIEFFTRSHISHVAIVSQNGAGKEVVEANNHVRGIGVYRYPAEVIKDYEGVVWLLRLSSPARARMQQANLEEFLFQNANKPFDTWGSMRSAEVLLPLIPILRQILQIVYRENLTKMFCSEFITAAWRSAGVVSEINPSEVTPADLCSFALYDSDYYQILGADLEIQPFNRSSPEKFGMK